MLFMESKLMNFNNFKDKFQKKPVREYPNHVSPNPVISICIQTYNQVNFISECLDSILFQNTVYPFEILLGDDCSTDGTREICISYAKKYPEKIRLFLHERENNIVVDNKSTGIFNSLFNIYSAKGEFIAYCDGDDYWTDPSKLQIQIDFLKENKQYVLSYHESVLIDQEGKEIADSELPELSKRDFTSMELKRATVQPIISTWCFRNCVDQIPFEITKTLNADNFWISLLGFHGEGKFMKEIEPSYYRIHKSGIWSLIKKDLQLQSKKLTYKNMSKYYYKSKEKELGDYYKERSKNYSKMLINYHLKQYNFFKVVENSFALLK